MHVFNLSQEVRTIHDFLAPCLQPTFESSVDFLTRTCRRLMTTLVHAAWCVPCLLTGHLCSSIHFFIPSGQLYKLGLWDLLWEISLFQRNKKISFKKLCLFHHSCSISLCLLPEYHWPWVTPTVCQALLAYKGK